MNHVGTYRKWESRGEYNKEGVVLVHNIFFVI